MNKTITSAALLFGAITLISVSALADTCSTGCTIQTKKASASKKGQFDYTLSCIKELQRRRADSQSHGGFRCRSESLGCQAVLIAP